MGRGVSIVHERDFWLTEKLRIEATSRHDFGQSNTGLSGVTGETCSLPIDKPSRSQLHLIPFDPHRVNPDSAEARTND
jgi:hypothetical protein